MKKGFLFKNVTKSNILVLILVSIAIISLVAYTSYALFSIEVNGKNNISVSAKVVKLFATTLLGANNSNVVTSGDGLYKTTETNDGKPSYYYRGNVTNNYVLLPEKNGDGATNEIYRIVRINEDGSIRLIKQETITKGRSLETFDYMYYTDSDVEDNGHKTKGAMRNMNDWYTATIEGTALDSKVVESSFCEEAKITWYNNDTLTVGSQKLVPVTNDYVPNLKCKTDANGRGLLSMKTGLLTVDEAVFAGVPFQTASYTENPNVYLNNGYYFWTISPAGLSDGGYVWVINDASGFIYTNNTAKYPPILRPVLSLYKGIEMTGNGTEDDPYIPILE